MVTLTSVTKKYGNVVAVNDISFTIDKGEYFALLGPNGAGKTTIVKMLLDFKRPTNGTVTINGLSSLDAMARVGVGYCAENHKIPPHLSARQYLLRIAALSGIEKKEADKKVDELIETVGMAGKDKLKAGTYSKGMVQRIALAGAIMGDPKLLILDEPVSGLDPIGIREVRSILEGLRSKGVTLILNSHLLSEVEKTCDSAAIINKGKILVKDRLSSIITGKETLEDVFVRVVKDSNA